MSNKLQRYTSFLQQRLDCSTGFLDQLIALDVFSDQQKKSCESSKVCRNYYKQNEKVLGYLNRKAVGHPECVETILEALRHCQYHLAKHISNKKGLSDEDFDLSDPESPLSLKQMKEIEKLSGPLCSSRILQCTEELLDKCVHETEQSNQTILNYIQYERILEEKGVCGRGKLLLDFIKRSSIGGLNRLVELLRDLGQDEAANKLENISCSFTCKVHISFGLCGRLEAHGIKPTQSSNVTSNNNRVISSQQICNDNINHSASLNSDCKNRLVSEISGTSCKLSSPNFGNFLENDVIKNCSHNPTELNSPGCLCSNTDSEKSETVSKVSESNLDLDTMTVDNQFADSALDNINLSNSQELEDNVNTEVNSTEMENTNENATKVIMESKLCDDLCENLTKFQEYLHAALKGSTEVLNSIKHGKIPDLLKNCVELLGAEVGQSIVFSFYCADGSALEKLVDMYNLGKLQASISNFLNNEFISKSEEYNDLIIEKIEIYDYDLEDMRKFCRDAKKKSLSPGEPRMLRKRRQTSTDSPETDPAQASVWDSEGIGFTKRRARVSSSMSPSSSSSSSSAYSCKEKSGLLAAFLHSMSTLSCSSVSGMIVTSLPPHIQEQILHKAAVSHISELAIVSLSSCFTAYVKLALVCQVWRTRLRSKSCRVRLKKLLIEFCHQHDIEDPSILRLRRNYVHISIANLPNHIQERMVHKAAAIIHFRQSAISSASSANAYMRLSSVRPAWRTILQSERFKMRLKRLLKDDSLFRSFRACPRQEVALELPISREGGVKGLTRLDQYYYALVNRFNKVFQFSCDKPYELIKSIEISELKFPTDIAACSKTHRLYIGDNDADCIWIVDSKIFKTCGKIENVKWPSQLSVTSDGRVLTVDDFGVLKMFSSDGTVVPFADRSTSKRLSSEVDHPWHVVEKTNGNFLVCYGENEYSDSGVIELSPTLETVAKFNFSQVPDLIFSVLPISRNLKISSAGNIQPRVEKPRVEMGGNFSARGVSEIGQDGGSRDPLGKIAGMYLAEGFVSTDKTELEKPSDGNLTAEKPTDDKSVIDEKPSLEIPVSACSSDNILTGTSSTYINPGTTCSSTTYPSIIHPSTIYPSITTCPQFFVPMVQSTDLTYQPLYQNPHLELFGSISSTLGTSLNTSTQLGTFMNTGTDSDTLSSSGLIAGTIVPQHEISGPITAQNTVPEPIGTQYTVPPPIIFQQQSHQLGHLLPIYASNLPLGSQQQQQQPTYPFYNLPNLPQLCLPNLPSLQQQTYPLFNLQQPTYQLPNLQQQTYPLPNLQQQTCPLTNLQQPTYPLPSLQQQTYPLTNLPNLPQPCLPIFTAYSAFQSQLASCSNLRTQPCPITLSSVQCPRFQNPETSSQTSRTRPSSEVSVSLRSPRAISLCPFDDDAFFVCDPMIGRVLLVSSDLGRARVLLDRDNGCPEKPFRMFFDVETRKLLVGDKESSNVHVYSV